MEFSRRLNSGTLAGTVSEAALEIDVFMRTVGLRPAAEATAKLIAVSHCIREGLPQWLDDHLDGILGVGDELEAQACFG